LNVIQRKTVLTIHGSNNTEEEEHTTGLIYVHTREREPEAT